ncbi:MAG: hypothetical protein M5U16_03155 [Hyphomicrobium sp.]|nr:hypothetical protein [Hyphomicrobium sp.]
MTISRKLTSITTAIALAAASLGSVTTAASAHERDYGYRGDHYSRGYDRHDGYRGGRDRYYARHHKKKDKTGKYIAIGAAALMLGIIASQASRH